MRQKRDLMCEKCIAAMEPAVKSHDLFKAPSGVCPVCWYRYGRYIPVCRPAAEIKGGKKRC